MVAVFNHICGKSFVHTGHDSSGIIQSRATNRGHTRSYRSHDKEDIPESPRDFDKFHFGKFLLYFLHY